MELMRPDLETVQNAQPDRIYYSKGFYDIFINIRPNIVNIVSI